MTALQLRKWSVSVTSFSENNIGNENSTLRTEHVTCLAP